MIFQALCVVQQRQVQLYPLLASTRRISQKIDPKKRVQALKMWKLWPIPYLIREKPKPATFYDRLAVGSGARYLAERSMTVGFFMVAFFFVFYATHLAETPVTHRKRFVILNSAVLEAISDEVFNMYVLSHQQTILSSRNQRYRVVERVANQIVQANLDIPEVLHKDWTVTVVNEPSYNIFALPTGQILVYEGMLSMCKTDEQLAAVLGHELAHAILGHTAEMANNLGIWDKVWMTGAMLMWSAVPFTHQFVAQYMARKMKTLFLHLPYNQLLEHEADKVGLQMLAKACFDVRESSAFWGRMETIQRMNYQHKIEWLTIHPDINRRRSKTVDRFLPEALRIRAENQCPPLPKHDPREDIGDFRQEIEQKLAGDPPVEKKGMFWGSGSSKKSSLTSGMDRMGAHIQEVTQNVLEEMQVAPSNILERQVAPSNILERQVAPSNIDERQVEFSNIEEGQVEPSNIEEGQVEPSNTESFPGMPNHFGHFDSTEGIAESQGGYSGQFDSAERIVESHSGHIHDHGHAPDYARSAEALDVPGELYVHEGHFHGVGKRTPIDKRL